MTSLSEFQLIEKYFKPLCLGQSNIILGPGDDCALTQLEPDAFLVTSVDTQIEGVHFPKNALPYDIGYRAFGAALSDLAAMGAKPLWYTLALTLPGIDERWLEQFSKGLKALASQHSMSLIGGDTTKGRLSITLQMHGAVKNAQSMLRSGAKINDIVCVTGTLGDGGGALKLMDQKIAVSTDDQAYFHEKFYRPTPRIKEALKINHLANSAIDISDGLLQDVGHIAKASQVEIHINIDKLPLSMALKKYFSRKQALELALSAGDDYELCLTMHENNFTKAKDLLENHNASLFYIGNVIGVCANGSVSCSYDNGDQYHLKNPGFRHF